MFVYGFEDGDDGGIDNNFYGDANEMEVARWRVGKANRLKRWNGATGGVQAGRWGRWSDLKRFEDAS